MDDMTPEQLRKVELGGQSTDAVHLSVSSYAVSMIDLSDEELPIGSGTFIEVFGHLFVATAAHCIPPNPNGRLCLLTNSPRRPADGILSFINHQADHKLDVGFLELEKQEADSYFITKQHLPLARLRPVGTGREKSLVSLVGCPADRVDLNRSHEGMSCMAAQLDAYSTVVLSPHEWRIPDDATEPPNIQNNIMLEYPETVRNFQSRSDMPAYRPQGFSGGGIWDHGYPCDGIWSPEKASVIGLSSYWFPSTRQLVGVQIIHWLRLVHAHYEDVREPLEVQFPDLLQERDEEFNHG